MSALEQNQGEVGHPGVEACHLCCRQMLVVPSFCLCGRGEDWLGQATAVVQTGWQLDAAHSAYLLVRHPAAAGQIAAHDSLDGSHLAVDYDHGPCPELWISAQLERQVAVDVSAPGDKVRGAQQRLVPEDGQGVERFALVGDQRVQDEVEDRHPVGGDDQTQSGGASPAAHLMLAEIEAVADLAAVHQLQAGVHQ